MATDPAFSGPELCRLSATEAVALLKRGEVSPAEMTEASLSRIETVEPAVNATVTVCAERARQAASATGLADTLLGGLPIGIKDLTAVAGVRSTWGTPGLAEHVPAASDPQVTRLEARGGIVMGKTNSPEMGAGGNTFNPVFGMTRNPWNTARNAGGSSGGAAVSLATGEVWLSHGSDLAGSLRTPAAYCGVVGLRPSPGLAGGYATDGFLTEAVPGPMARNVADCALFLDAMAGFDPQWPVSFPPPETPFAETVTRDPGRLRVAYSPDLGGFAAVEPAMDQALRTALSALEAQGDTVEEACPEMPDLDRVYRTLRGLVWVSSAAGLPPGVEDRFKATLKQNIAEGRALTAADIAHARLGRMHIYNHFRVFLERFDVLACPVAGLSPGPVEQEYPTHVAGRPMRDYLDWLAFSFPATTAGLPAISVPVGFDADGMPVGLQLIGQPRGEERLLQIAHKLEKVLGLNRTPIDPRPASEAIGA